MQRMIFVNLPVSDLPRSRRFYQALGFSINEQFSDETAACVVVSETIYLMILTHARFQGFSILPMADTSKTTGCFVALSCDSRAAVDTMLAAGLAQGGSEERAVNDMGFMYQRTLSDPDGNVLEPFWMDPGAVQG